jgi:hypothetical protein
MKHKGSETPESGNAKEKGEYLICPSANLLPCKNKQDDVSQAGYQRDYRPYTQPVTLPGYGNYAITAIVLCPNYG